MQLLSDAPSIYTALQLRISSIRSNRLPCIWHNRSQITAALIIDPSMPALPPEYQYRSLTIKASLLSISNSFMSHNKASGSGFLKIVAGSQAAEVLKHVIFGGILLTTPPCGYTDGCNGRFHISFVYIRRIGNGFASPASSFACAYRSRRLPFHRHPWNRLRKSNQTG